jgi:hypothetical protein
MMRDHDLDDFVECSDAEMTAVEEFRYEQDERPGIMGANSENDEEKDNSTLDDEARTVMPSSAIRTWFRP